MSERLWAQRQSLKPFLCEWAPPFSSQVGLKEVEDILREVDLNGDGLVDFEGKSLTKMTYLKHVVELRVNAALSLSSPLLFFTEFVRMMSRWDHEMIISECEAESFWILDQVQQRTRWDLWAAEIWMTLESKLLECYVARSHLTLSINKCSSWNVSSSTEAEFAVA